MLRKDGSDTDTGRHGNKCRTQYRPDPPELLITKVAADSVPLGFAVSRNGKNCWAAYDNGALVAVGSSADDARRKWRAWRARPVQHKANE